jgi:hypothetical protein
MRLVLHHRAGGAMRLKTNRSVRRSFGSMSNPRTRHGVAKNGVTTLVGMSHRSNPPSGPIHEPIRSRPAHPVM